MPSFYHPDNRCGGESRTNASIQLIKVGRPHHAVSFSVLCRLLALLLAFAVAPPVLLAQEADHLNGRDKVCDPTGAWLIKSTGGAVFLMVFHKGGTFTGDRQGESAFDPSAVKPPNPPLNVIGTPLSGVWQKTGWNTFAATLLSLEYEVRPNGDAPVF
jgi:hypothetical protein